MSIGRRHGSDFEKRVATKVGGYVWRGLDGDVEDYTHGYRIECKYRVGLNLESGHTLKDWLDQVARYALKWPPGRRWALVFTGGKSYQNAALFVVLPFAEWRRLVEGKSGD
jgi:hypothetical protein